MVAANASRSGRSSTITLPVCIPARLKVLVAAVIITVRAFASGAATAKGMCRWPGRTMSQWISSETTIRSCFSAKAASAFCSASDQQRPPGLWGEQKMIIRSSPCIIPS